MTIAATTAGADSIAYGDGLTWELAVVASSPQSKIANSFTAGAPTILTGLGNVRFRVNQGDAAPTRVQWPVGTEPLGALK